MTSIASRLTLEQLLTPMGDCPFHDEKTRQWWAEGYNYAYKYPRNAAPTIVTKPALFGDAYRSGFFLARARQSER